MVVKPIFERAGCGTDVAGEFWIDRISESVDEHLHKNRVLTVSGKSNIIPIVVSKNLNRISSTSLESELPSGFFTHDIHWCGGLP